MDPDAEPWEIAKDLSRKQYRILLAIQSSGGEARTRNVTSTTGLPNNQVNYHYDKLMNADLIERLDGSEETAQPGSLPRRGYTYRLTERGREALSAAQEDYSLTPLGEGEVRRRFDDLEGRVERIEERLDQVVGDQHQQNQKLEQHDEDIEGIGKALKRLVGEFQEFRERLDQRLSEHS
jgi:DNA-binding MarR family transcriptional regulator